VHCDRTLTSSQAGQPELLQLPEAVPLKPLLLLLLLATAPADAVDQKRGPLLGTAAAPAALVHSAACCYCCNNCIPEQVFNQ
jgi:hypothetical protein